MNTIERSFKRKQRLKKELSESGEEGRAEKEGKRRGEEKKGKERKRREGKRGEPCKVLMNDRLKVLQ